MLKPTPTIISAEENSVPIPTFAFLRLENGNLAGGRSPSCHHSFQCSYLQFTSALQQSEAVILFSLLETSVRTVPQFASNFGHHIAYFS